MGAFIAFAGQLRASPIVLRRSYRHRLPVDPAPRAQRDGALLYDVVGHDLTGCW